MAADRLRVAVFGASGYVGGELLRLLLGHPQVEIAAATSTRYAGRPVSTVHPNLRGLTGLRFRSPEEMGGFDVVFLAAELQTAIKVGADLAKRDECLIDLSPAYRLRDPAVFERYYGTAHTAPELLGSFVSGHPEDNRAALRTARLVSVPGCMVIATLIALRPFAADDLVDGDVIVDCRIGSSGSGAAAERLNLHAERSGALRVFAPHGHRHEAEVCQASGLAVRMTATGVEAVRGAQVVCHVPLRRPLSEVEIRRLYRDAYADEPFVRVIAQRRGLYRLPEPKILIGSNFCDVGFSVTPDGRRVVAVAALDNLMKGSAGTGVQCLNIRMGWPERLGLAFAGLHPI
ncbi:N-acetyl-gamma-glutamyl-phosphate reductase [Nonomuraea fuscirosea]|uniref:N-acetyl-gamma-glutamyl-phosphate reductase n=1 Tax=Nonomuraea fuscirosea TaxID=1291556 RepID=UPI0033F3F6FE